MNRADIERLQKLNELEDNRSKQKKKEKLSEQI